MQTMPVNTIILPLFCAALPVAIAMLVPRRAQGPGRSRTHNSAARRDSDRFLLTLFIISPTLGTIVATWRGLKRIQMHWIDELTLKDRAFALHDRQSSNTHPQCRICGFGTLQILGDSVLKENALLARHLWRSDDGAPIEKLNPQDRRCNRPGCGAIALTPRSAFRTKGANRAKEMSASL